MVREEWCEKFGHLRSEKDPRKRPICRLLGSSYGRDRAGHDYDRHANKVLETCGFKADVDVDPCVYTKKVPDEFVDKVRASDAAAGSSIWRSAAPGGEARRRRNGGRGSFDLEPGVWVRPA